MRRRLAILLSVVAWGSFVIIGLWRMETNIEDLFPWLPESGQQREEYAGFIERFGSDDTLIVSWVGCSLDDPRIHRLEQVLLRDWGHWVSDVTSAPQLIDELTSPPASMGRAEAIQRLQGVLVGPDGSTAAMLIHLSDAGMLSRRESVGDVVAAAVDVGIPREDLRLGGRPYNGYYSAEQTRQSLVWLSIPVAIIAAGLAWLCFRDIRLMAVTLACSGGATLTSFALIPWTGHRVNGLLAALPSLINVIATSGAIHVANYSLAIHRREVLTGELRSRREHAAAVQTKAFGPCLLSTMSTALGSLSLVGSEFPALREFGIFATISVLIAFVFQIHLLPGLLAHVHHHGLRGPQVDHIAGMFAPVLRFVLRWRNAVALAVVAITAVLIAPLFRLEGRYTIDRMFTEDSELVRNTRWLEEHIGPVDTTEIILRIDDVSPGDFLSRIRRIQTLEQSLAEVPSVAGTFSSATMLPNLHEFQKRSSPFGSPVVSLYLLRGAVDRRRAELTEGTHLAIEGETEFWRITIRTPLFSASNRSKLIGEIQSRIAQQTADWPQQPHVTITGGSHLFFQAQSDVLRDFAENIGLACVLIFLLVVVVFRSLPLGFVAMLPNFVPIIVVFGLLGWIDGTIDIGMTVAGCIALGIAVDDTSHVLVAYQQARQFTGGRERALRIAYSQTATPVIQTSLICGLSMLPYLTASMVYLSRFGLLLSVLMAAALVADLLFLPALVAGPLGRLLPDHRSARIPGE